MDYKDLAVVGSAALFGMAGAVFGPVGLVGGILLGAGVGAKVMAESDEIAALRARVEELESEREE